MKEIRLNKGFVSLVDDADFEWLNQWKWHIVKDKDRYYAKRNKLFNGKYKSVSMHREILKLNNENILSDHADRDGLNNQRENLRIANKSQNGANRNKKQNAASIYLGVFWRGQRNKWKAEIRKNGKLKCVGSFDSEKDAALAYNKAAIELHGEFANLNNITVNA